MLKKNHSFLGTLRNLIENVFGAIDTRGRPTATVGSDHYLRA